MSRVWELSDALAFRCPVELVGTLAPAEVLQARELAAPALPEIRERALMALLKVAEHGENDYARVRAAVALLEHVSRETYPGNVAQPWPEGVTPETRYAPAPDALPELRQAGTKRLHAVPPGN